MDGEGDIRIEPPGSPVFAAAPPLFVWVWLVVSQLAVHPWPPVQRVWTQILAETVVAAGAAVFAWRVADRPPCVIVGPDGFTVRAAFSGKAQSWAYADMLYFEARRRRVQRTEYWTICGVRRDGRPQRIPIPSLGGRTDIFLFRPLFGPTDPDNLDLQAFKALKAALERWQAEHGVVVPPRYADAADGVLT